MINAIMSYAEGVLTRIITVPVVIIVVQLIAASKRTDYFVISGEYQVNLNGNSQSLPSSP